MTRQLSCDDHVLYRAGCADCQARGRYYEGRRVLLANRGVRLSCAVDLTASRLKELRAAGYSLPQIAAHANVGVATLNRICNDRVTWVQLRVFHAIERVYAEWRLFPGPSPQVAAKARLRGWTPPPALPMPPEIEEDSVDEVAVRRAVDGDTAIPLTRAEQTEAWRILERRGMSARQIGEVLGVTARTIDRIRNGHTRRMYGRRSG